MVRIRMKRMGRRNRPFYRINAIEKRVQRDGKVIEPLGWYDPISQDPAKQVSLNGERIKHWLGVGAQATPSVLDLLLKHGVIEKDYWQTHRGDAIDNRKKLRDQKLAKAKAAEAAAAAPAGGEAKAEG